MPPALQPGSASRMIRPFFSMNKVGLLLLPLILLLAQPLRSLAQENDPSEVFLKAYMTAQQGEKLERENQFQPALAKFRFAGAMLEELKKASPDWQPAIVEYRSRKIGEAILRVKSKISTESDLAATAPAPAEIEPTLPSVTAPGPRVEVAPARSGPDATNQAAIQNATQQLQQKIESLEAELTKSRQEIAEAQKEKMELKGKLDQTSTALGEARENLVRASKAEKDVREQLSAAQASLREIQATGSTDQKAVLALKGEISQLTKALEAAEAGRAAAEKESAASHDKLNEAANRIASVTRERDALMKERDNALQQLRAAGDAQARVQALVAENTDLKQKLATAENTVREISADRPRKAQELQEVKQQLEKMRDQLVASQQQNQEAEKTIANLRSQLDEASGALAAAKLAGATPDETAQLVKENQMLRAIVVREREEEARREQARKLMLAEFDKLKIKSHVLDKQIQRLAEPVTKLSPEELALLRTPVVAISDTDPGTVKASLTMAKPEKSAPITIPNSESEPPPPAAKIPETWQGAPNGTSTPGGPEVETTFKPGVPPDMLPLAQQAKRNFDRGNFVQAEKQYEQILAKNPNNLYSLSNLGVVLFRNGKLKAAELTLKKALAVAPKDEFTHTTLGIVYYRQSKFDEALSELTKSLAINPKSATAHNYLGITASQKGWQEAAEKEMLEAIANDPDYADAHFNLAVVYSTASPPAKELARRHYEKALALGAQADPTLDKLLR